MFLIKVLVKYFMVSHYRLEDICMHENKVLCIKSMGLNNLYRKKINLLLDITWRLAIPPIGISMQ